MNIDLIVGARPSFMKAAPVVRELRARKPEWRTRVIHTGRNYNEKLSAILFDRLGMAKPEVNLGVGSASHTHQTAATMLALEGWLRTERPDLVMVFGDTNATLAASLVATQLRIPLAHVDAGLRSFDRGTPGEINRLLTDAVADLLFVSERAAEQNLRNEGIPDEKVHFVGNPLVDCLVRHRRDARAMRAAEALELSPRSYVVFTVEGTDNIDNEEQLRSIVYALESLADNTDVVFPEHRRTVQRLKDFGLWNDMNRGRRLRVIKPPGYFRFMSLLDSAGAVVTDSSYVQEEAVALGVPCVTLCGITERPVTLENGANRLAGEDPHLAVRYALDALRSQASFAAAPEGWDGKASARIVDVLEEGGSLQIDNRQSGNRGMARSAIGNRAIG